MKENKKSYKMSIFFILSLFVNIFFGYPFSFYVIPVKTGIQTYSSSIIPRHFRADACNDRKLFRHSRENGNPNYIHALWIDSRLRGNDERGARE
jgi:hypothetical protein